MEKSAIVLYKQHHSRVNNTNPIRVNNKIIPYKSNTNILGVNIDCKMTLNKHITFRYNITLNTLHKLNRFLLLFPRLSRRQASSSILLTLKFWDLKRVVTHTSVP